MGMYTEFVFGGALHDDVPDHVVAILRYLVEPIGSKQAETYFRQLKIPDHPFFQTDRWQGIAISSSCYFGYNQPHSALVYDEINRHWVVAIRSSIKNYSHEIEKFVDWIRPYIRKGSGEQNFISAGLKERSEKTPCDSGGMKAEPLRPTIRYFYLG
jgi:hypothetical protein